MKESDSVFLSTDILELEKMGKKTIQSAPRCSERCDNIKEYTHNDTFHLVFFDLYPSEMQIVKCLSLGLSSE